MNAAPLQMMAPYFQEQLQTAAEAWEEGLDLMPAPVRGVAAKFPPWLDYRIKETGHPCKILGIKMKRKNGKVKLLVLVSLPNGEVVLGHVKPREVEPVEVAQ